MYIQLGTGQGILLNDMVLNVWEISKLLSKKGMLLTHNAWQKLNNIQLSPEGEVNRGVYPLLFTDPEVVLVFTKSDG